MPIIYSLPLKKANGLTSDKIVVDSYTPDIPHDADEATVRKVLGEWLDQFGTARHYVGLNFGSHPLEYKVLYELSRKLYNP